ncbi:amidase [Roseomonas terrae]|jgi:Asp-tRNA(Asn)/Glu-tRNA(Gln) amidotransferase A subunit family amidase|uniref:Amidase n=1 Tax=Neoroseomonas terrae TaxID=424799 RepID=A0ABS5EF52_9PROT|nr:amidase [Neoroseomonas terrae]MBR0649644.1 amidase [Neoroseomonas terrae]
MDLPAPQTYSPVTFRPLTFHDAVPRFLSGEDTPRAYLERCLETIAAREPEVMAFAHLNAEGARAAADESTARHRAGVPLSPIDGLPIGIKDLYETHDMPTEMGCELYKGNRPNRDSAMVQALRAAGAVIVGKTVTTELGMSHPGPTRHPFDLRRTPGGSSSGSAAVISAGMLPVAIGSQVVGSVVRPASFNANWALKVSQGALNRGERQGYSQSTVGVHAGCPEDMWAVAVEIAKRVGGDPGAPGLFWTGETAPPAFKPRRLAVLETEGWAAAHPGAIAAFEQALDALRAAGVTVLRRGDHPLLEAFEQRASTAMEMSREVVAYESGWSVANLMRQDASKLSDSLKARFKVGNSVTLADYRMHLLRREEMRRAQAALAGEVDAFIGLAATGPAPVLGSTDGTIRGITHTTGNPAMNTASSCLGCPVVTVPIMAVDGMPVALAVSGQVHQDERATAIGRWIAGAVPPIMV